LSWRELHGVIVASHLKISNAAKRQCISCARENDGAFPIIWGQLCFASLLLGCQRSLRLESDS